MRFLLKVVFSAISLVVLFCKRFINGCSLWGSWVCIIWKVIFCSVRMVKIWLMVYILWILDLYVRLIYLKWFFGRFWILFIYCCVGGKEICICTCCGVMVTIFLKWLLIGIFVMDIIFWFCWIIIYLVRVFVGWILRRLRNVMVR